MQYMEFLPILFLLMVYGIANSVVITALFLLVRPALSFSRLFVHMLLKVAVAMAIVIGFFYLLNRSFCWSAWLMQCVECICPTATSRAFILEPGLPAAIFFFLGMTSVELVTIPIIEPLQPLTFVLIICTANLVATFLRLGLGALFGW